MTKTIHKMDELSIAIFAFHKGETHLIAMEKEKLVAVESFAKMATKNIVPTGRSRAELLEFLNYKEEPST